MRSINMNIQEHEILFHSEQTMHGLQWVSLPRAGAPQQEEECAVSIRNKSRNVWGKKVSQRGNRGGQDSLWDTGLVEKRWLGTCLPWRSRSWEQRPRQNSFDFSATQMNSFLDQALQSDTFPQKSTDELHFWASFSL